MGELKINWLSGRVQADWYGLDVRAASARLENEELDNEIAAINAALGVEANARRNER